MLADPSTELCESTGEAWSKVQIYLRDRHLTNSPVDLIKLNFRGNHIGYRCRITNRIWRTEIPNFRPRPRP